MSLSSSSLSPQSSPYDFFSSFCYRLCTTLAAQPGLLSSFTSSPFLLLSSKLTGCFKKRNNRHNEDMMEGAGRRKTTDYIWVSLLPWSNFSHLGCYGSSTLYPHISETWQIVQTFKEKLDQYLIWWKFPTSPVFWTSPNWSKTRGSAFHLSPSFTNDQVLTTTRRGRTRPSAWVEPSRNHSLKDKDRQSGPQCVCFVFLYFVFLYFCNVLSFPAC